MPSVSLSWDEGRYFDLWMLVHLLSGVAGGFSNVYFRFPDAGVYALGAAMMLAWEVGERVIGVRESWSNRALDIGIGVLGIWMALAIAPLLPPRAAAWSFAATLLCAIVLLGFGVRAYNARTRAQ